MKILHQSISKKTEEIVIKILVEREDDIYECHNLISKGDIVTASTTRNIVHESSTGKTEKTKTKLTISFDVEQIYFDVDLCSLRLTGRNIKENDKIKIGQYQSVDITVGTTFTISKLYIDESILEYLKEISSPIPKEHVIVVTMQFGLANICMVSSDTTFVISHITRNIPKKREYVNGRDKAITDFFRDIYAALKKQLAKVQYRSVVVLGSPGFLNTEFLAYCIEVSSKADDLEMSNCCKNKFTTCHTSSGYKSAVSEIFADPDIKKKVEGLKLFDQVNILSSFHDVLREEEDRVCYGLKEVVYAHELKAINDLLIVDTLYKVNDPIGRKRMKNLMDGVEEIGGKVHKFSSRHITGQELSNVTGIAAILRFPVPGLSDLVASVAPPDVHDNALTKAVQTTNKPTKTREEEETEAFTKSLLDTSKINDEYDEFDGVDELDEDAIVLEGDLVDDE